MCCIGPQQYQNVQIADYVQATMHPARAELGRLRHFVAAFKAPAGSNRIWWTLGNGTLIPSIFACLLCHLHSFQPKSVFLFAISGTFVNFPLFMVISDHSSSFFYLPPSLASSSSSVNSNTVLVCAPNFCSTRASSYAPRS